MFVEPFSRVLQAKSLVCRGRCKNPQSSGLKIPTP
jgi:hypothetical protein